MSDSENQKSEGAAAAPVCEVCGEKLWDEDEQEAGVCIGCAKEALP